jgi:hypothetical protein
VWGEGNILLGGEGDDILQGRGGNDILDGDRWMNVRLSVRTDPADPSTELGTTNLMENKATTGNFGNGTANMTLQQAVFKGLVDPGNIVAVREIVTPTPASGGNDVARFSFPAIEYDATPNGDGSVTVTHFGGTAVDGIDTLRNIELLQFCAVPGLVRGDCAAWADAKPVPTPPVPTPFPSLSAGALFFGDQLVSTTSGIQTLTIQNIGSAPLQITGASLGGPNAAAFAITNGCTTPVAPLDTCAITASFTPGATGSLQALLTITHNAFGSPELVGLVGNGTVPMPVAQVSAPSILFANQRTGTTSAARTVTITNTGAANLEVSGVTVTGVDSAAFGVTNGCTSPVAPTLSCTISVTFAPATIGAKTATLQVTHNATASPTLVGLSGTGLAPAVQVSVTALAFGNQTVPTTSANRAVTVTNTGTANLVVTGVTTTGTGATSFVVANGCTAPVAPAASCTINVRFAPVSVGAKTATVAIANNAGGPRQVALTGTGTRPVIQTPATAAFAATRAGATRAINVRVTNLGPGPLLITAVTTTGRFTATRGNCPVSLAAGAACNVVVTFAPNAVANFTGQLRIVSNATVSPKITTLTGPGR